MELGYFRKSACSSSRWGEIEQGRYGGFFRCEQFLLCPLLFLKTKAVVLRLLEGGVFAFIKENQNKTKQKPNS